MHVSFEVAPAAVEYVPISQSVQVPAPGSTLYLPAGHASHACPSGPVKPAGHLHSCRPELPMGDCEFSGHCRQVSGDAAASVCEYVPASHVSQGAVPWDSLYFPALQATHVCPFAGLVYPALQMQSVSCVLPGCESVFSGQSSSHGADPASGLYLPAGHSSQGPPSGPNDPASHCKRHELEFALSGGEV